MKADQVADGTQKMDANTANVEKGSSSGGIKYRNQVFRQCAENVRLSIKRSLRSIEKSNQLRVEDEELQAEVLDYLKRLDRDLEQVIDTVEKNGAITSFEEQTEVSGWLEENWPEVVAKLGEYTSKKALADMLVPTCIVGAFAIFGGMVGLLVGAPLSAGIGTGAFLGMYATGKVGIKEASNKLEGAQEPDS